MTKEKYGIRKSEAQFPPIDLLPEVEYNGKILNAAVFGPNYFSKNVENMQKQYFHSKQLPNITFRSATTSEAIAIASNGFNKKGEFDAKRDILDPRWLQLARIGRASEGIYLNIPKDKNGNPIGDEKELKQFINKAKKVNGIWIVPNGKFENVRDFVFVPYDTFEQKVYENSKEFAESGLARGLECSNGKKAEKLENISSKENYPNGASVLGWGSSKNLQLRIPGLLSVDGLLLVGGDDWGDYDGGFAFGVCSKGKNK